MNKVKEKVFLGNVNETKRLKKTRKTVTMDPKLSSNIDAIAKKLDVSFSCVVENALLSFFGWEKK